ncbi:hypothetical protein [Polyangium jinanense]|uniref:Uncharacterized protein n=1 Tax=Polyangium jinanense TaxID=2829994 RepID=A0A9X3XD00_9BACT|nr:hypothetical protein [Polyangium jinanense]MDC3958175.1 hypothetical protein [Polyangium jinanense]MDC3988139.1 hypothetical protein [Polyangium jinanense]
MAEVSDNKVLKQVFVYVTLDIDDPRLLTLQKLLLAYKVQWSEDRWDEYTDEEYEAARLIVVQALSENHIVGGPRFYTEYDLSNACPACGAGMRQTGTYWIDGAGPQTVRLGQFRAVSSYSEILVDQPLAETLARANLSGLSLRSVYAYQPDEAPIELIWRQLWASHTLPPMSPRSTGIDFDSACKSCRRGKIDSTSPERFAYRAKDVEGAQDVNRMWEHFGYVRWNGDLKTAVLWQPYFVVTPKVWRIFRDAGVTGFQWLPIRVVEDE